MRIQFLKYSTYCLALLTVIVHGQLFAQEPVDQEPVDQEPISVTRPEVKYIDAPVAIKTEVDPILPPPTVVLIPEDDPEFIRRIDTIREYGLAVEQIETVGGVWDQELVEELATLGDLQQQQGSHPEAIATFNRAIHINRINSGLYTLEQIPVVEKMIESHLALGEWEQADLYYNYLFFVQQKAFGANDPRIIPILERLANWNIQAFNIGYGESLGVRLSSAQILFSAAARMVGVHFGKGDERFVSYLHNLASSAYLVATNPGLMEELNKPQIRMNQDILRRQLNERSAIPRGFQVGESALLDIAQYYDSESDSVYESAEALANLGDWYLLFSRRRAAEEKYQQAWNMLSGREDGEELIQQLFGQVVPLPAFISNSADNLVAAAVSVKDSMPLEYDYVDISFDVTVRGTTRNIQILSEKTEANSAHLLQLSREVRRTYFRPLIVDGAPVRSSNNQFRYRYWY